MSLTRGELWIICRRALSSGAFRAQQEQPAEPSAVDAPDSPEAPVVSLTHSGSQIRIREAAGCRFTATTKRSALQQIDNWFGKEVRRVGLRRGFCNENIRR